MSFLRTARRLATLALACGATAAAHAAYFTWETVELPASSGASCSNGTPYRFFVNRTPFSSKTVVVFEGGGACWEQKACKGGDLLSAVNPNGVATNYMSDIAAQAHLGLVTPFTMRLHPLQSVQTQSWNIVYVTYCTGDVHTGNQVNVYDNIDPANPMTFYHRGKANSEGVAQWMAKNMPQPAQLLLTGFSAGGVASTAHYDTFRTLLKPKVTALLADSGPLFQAPKNSTPEISPSLPLHTKIRASWGLDGSTGLITALRKKYPGVADFDNLGAVAAALPKIYPKDRLGFAVFQEDTNFSGFSYQYFYPEIQNAPDEATRLALLNQKWRKDLTPWIDALKPFSNVGYYLPFKRNLNGSHCLTIVTFGGTGVKEANIKDVGAFVDNLLAPSGALMRVWQQAQEIQNVTISDYLAEILSAFI